ncbi:MAG: wax ester/triacylglycerol synthase family O-acyltransferase [Gemmatimonadota bacterium]
MRQLSGHDAAFLYSDNVHSNANVSLIHIYDQSTAPGGKVRFKSILAHIESRLHRSPVFRQKLRRVPFELDHPYWVEDENFDLEYHVRHIALPKPGDWRQFCIQAARIHARPLDRSRPLWEIYVIEGLDSFLDLPAGSFALLTKVHHAAIDVEHGSEITMLLHDLTATPARDEPPEPWFPESPPGIFSLVCRGLMSTLTSPLRLAGPLTRAVRRVTPAAFSLARDILLRPERLPVTRFNSVVSPHRVFETRRFVLDEFKEIRSLVDGATVNDAVLAVCGGALRRYLAAEHELPQASLTAIAPFYIREADADTGERPDVSWLHLRLGTDLADPVQRLAQIRDQMQSSDTVARAVGARELTDIGQHAPAATLALTSKLLGRAYLGIGHRAPLANCTITNVPGPTVPLYLCGARMTYFSAIMPISDGMGLVFAVTSYDGKVVISPTSCRELLPDPEAFAQCVRDSFQEYLAAARRSRHRRSAPRAKKTPVRPARPRRSAADTGSPTRLAA